MDRISLLKEHIEDKLSRIDYASLVALYNYLREIVHEKWQFAQIAPEEGGIPLSEEYFDYDYFTDKIAEELETRLKKDFFTI
jgi:hypothetical protein